MNILDSIKEYILSVGFLPIFIFAWLVALFIYWSESKKTNKNQNSIFDGFFISSFLSLIWGRVAYIVAYPENYLGLPWGFAPYERYPDGFYLFRILPWRYVRFWDGEFMFTGLFVGLFLGILIYSIFIKRWRWKEMLSPTVLTSSVALGVILSVYGFVSDVRSMLVQGVVMIGISLVYSVISFLLRKQKKQKFFEILNLILIGIYSSAISIYISLSLINSDITSIDKWNIYVFLILSAFSIIVYIIDTFKKSVNIKTKYRTRSVSISTNQPVKI